MPIPITVASSTEAGRAVASGDHARRMQDAKDARAAARAGLDALAAKKAAAALNSPQDAPLFDDAPAAQPAAPAKPSRPTSLNEAHALLCKPFAPALVELKPGAITGDKSRALCMPFVDIRAYQTRLDRVVGPEAWRVEYRSLSDRAVLCRLTILGVTREDVGECNASDENAATSAVAQSFKRACSAFGLGRYLYSLPQVWSAYDEKKRQIVDVAGVVAQMYASLPRGEE